jgi:hypothetical protein
MGKNVPISQIKDGKVMLLIISVCMIMLCLHLFKNSVHISDRFFWYDESTTYDVSKRPFYDIPSISARSHMQPPLFYWVAHGMIQIGDSPIHLRGISFLFTGGMIVFVMFGLKELLISSRWVLCMLLTLNPHALFLSREFRPYALAAFFILLSGVMLLRALKQPESKTAAIWYGITALGLQYSLALNCWVFACQMLCVGWVILVESKKHGLSNTLKRFAPLIAICLVLSLEYLFFLLWLASKNTIYTEKIALIEKRSYWGALAVNLKDHLFRKIMFQSNLWGWISIGLFVSGAVAILQKRCFMILSFLVLVILGQVIFSTYMTYSRINWFHPRYLTSCYVAYAVWCALAYEFFISRQWSLKKSLAPVMVLVIIMFAPTAKAFIKVKESPPLQNPWEKVVESKHCRDCRTYIVCAPVYISVIPMYLFRYSDDIQVIRNFTAEKVKNAIDQKSSVLFMGIPGKNTNAGNALNVLRNVKGYRNALLELKHMDLNTRVDPHFPDLLHLFYHQSRMKKGIQRTVCSQCSVNRSIQKAIDAAADLDRILVGSGEYYEDVNLNSKRVILESSPERGNRVINGKIELSGKWIILKNPWIISGKME